MSSFNLFCSYREEISWKSRWALWRRPRTRKTQKLRQTTKQTGPRKRRWNAKSNAHAVRWRGTSGKENKDWGRLMRRWRLFFTGIEIYLCFIDRSILFYSAVLYNFFFSILFGIFEFLTKIESLVWCHCTAITLQRYEHLNSAPQMCEPSCTVYLTSTHWGTNFYFE